MEPWFLGPGATGPGGDDFAQWQKEVTAKYGTQFFSSLKDLPKPEQPRLSLISGRTADNPRLLEESIATGCTTIYLEKPGAPTVAELQSMALKAKEANVPVLMGYNKVISKSARFMLSTVVSCEIYITQFFFANIALLMAVLQERMQVRHQDERVCGNSSRIANHFRLQ